ncbi:hypothetical protein AM493_14205 [Flavobacterium akiainvivens]|uniref:EF-hand domain-containing protein n=1 Tax=Flavobacterium akiainvivens TaxID=1202724 RepID=A0A0M8MJG0_9FLAO|nr:hypothetical protein [Flavobacterium akiainvivens]KOS07057.1 hypothetical protein AM493_14205 [Flavobacterium akiainvivens]SFQ58680.1 EF hand [Flavobacterium akiainvivens]
MNKKVFALLLMAGLFTTAGAVAQEKVIKGERLQKAKDAFEDIDTDKDGKISKAEAEKGPKGYLNEHFAEIDTNKDNFVEKPELKAYLKDKKEFRQDKKAVLKPKQK